MLNEDMNDIGINPGLDWIQPTQSLIVNWEILNFLILCIHNTPCYPLPLH